jgi:hypothetical protein
VGVGVGVAVGAAAIVNVTVASGALAVRTSEAESSLQLPEVRNTSRRKPVCPVRLTFSGTLTFIHPLLTLNEIVETSAAPPIAHSRSEPLTVPIAGFTQIVAVYVARTATAVDTV